jgi:hypothetical protein
MNELLTELRDLILTLPSYYSPEHNAEYIKKVEIEELLNRLIEGDERPHPTLPGTIRSTTHGW